MRTPRTWTHIGRDTCMLIVLHHWHFQMPYGSFRRLKWSWMDINRPYAPGENHTILSRSSHTTPFSYHLQTILENPLLIADFSSYPIRNFLSIATQPMSARYSLASAQHGSGSNAVRRQLPTKHASPRRLSEELKALLGQDANFNVEVSSYSQPRFSEFGRQVQ